MNYLNKKFGLLGLLVLAIFSLTVFGLLQMQIRLPGSGIIKTVGVSCNVSSIDFGSVAPNSITAKQIVLTNNGTSPVALALATENWNPSSASTILSLSWDYSGQTLQPNASVTINLQLAVAEDVEGLTAFSFDVVITAVES